MAGIAVDMLLTSEGTNLPTEGTNLPTPSEAFPTFVSFTRLREAPEEGEHGSIDGPELFQ